MRNLMISVVACAAFSTAALQSSDARAACAFQNEIPVKISAAAFQAWKSVTEAMAECGNVEAELSQEFQLKQAAGFAAKPSLYHIGGVANSSMVPLLNEGLIRPLNDLVAEYGQQLNANQLIRVNDQVMAIAMMINAQHLMYRADILDELGLDVPGTYEDVLAAAEQIKAADLVEYPLGGTWKTTWLEFVNMYLGYGGAFFSDGVQPAINNEKGLAALEMMSALSAYMDPEFLVSDSTYVQQQFQQGKIAMANLWASRAGAMDDAAESQVVGKVKMASAPAPTTGGIPAATLWWDGIVIASNISDLEAANAFRVAMEGMDTEMVKSNNDAAVWIIEGYQAGTTASGAAATAQNGAKPYPASTQMGLMQKAIQNNIADFLTGVSDAVTTLAEIEADYLVSAKEAGLL